MCMQINSSSTLSVLDAPFEHSGEIFTFITKVARLMGTYRKWLNIVGNRFDRYVILRINIIIFLNAHNKIICKKLFLLQWLIIIVAINDTTFHISIDESDSANFDLFMNKSWGVWESGHPNTTVGKCIGGYKGRMISVNCIEKLPFVCEMYVFKVLTILFNAT